MKPLSVLSRSLALAVLLGLPCALQAAEGSNKAPVSSVPVSDEVVQLPKIEVVDSRVLPEREAWRYAQIPGYEILTRTSDRNTRLFVREFSRLQQVLTVLWPSIRQNSPEVPVSIILCDRGDNFDDFVPPAKRADQNRINGLFYQNKEAASIVVDFALQDVFTGVFKAEDFKVQENNTPLDPDMIDTTVMETNIKAGVERADPLRAFRLGYLRFLIDNSSGGRLPEWFKTGLLEMLSSIDYTKKSIEVGRIGDVGGSKSTDFNAALLERGLLSMPELFSPEPKDPNLAYTWRKQCYAFVHYCLFGERRSHAAALVKYLERIDKSAPTEAVFKECFGENYSGMELALRGYVQYTDHTYAEYKAKGWTVFEDPPKAETREATDSEVGRIKGEALRLSGQPEAARDFIIAPYVRGERDPDLLAVLGLAEYESGQMPRARKFFEAAVKLDTHRARAYVLLAELRANEALVQSPKKCLQRADLGRVLPLLVKARSLPPLLPEIYEVAADSWHVSDLKPTREEFNFMLQGALRFPTRLQLVYRVALIAARNDFVYEAQLLIAHGERYCPDQRGRSLFAKLRDDYPALKAPLPAEADPVSSPAPLSGKSSASTGPGALRTH